MAEEEFMSREAAKTQSEKTAGIACIQCAHYAYKAAYSPPDDRQCCRQDVAGFDLVLGAVTVPNRRTHCARERRNQSWWDRLFGQDRCGPEGQFFKPIPPKPWQPTRPSR